MQQRSEAEGILCYLCFLMLELSPPLWDTFRIRKLSQPKGRGTNRLRREVRGTGHNRGIQHPIEVNEDIEQEVAEATEVRSQGVSLLPL